MTSHYKDIAMMGMPVQCDCGEWFDFQREGNCCDVCAVTYCDECLSENFGICDNCKKLEEQ